MPNSLPFDYDKLKKQLTLDEGERLRPYTDTRGKVTIGVGHNLTDDGISANISDALFAEDVTTACARLARIYPNWTMLDEVRIRVLVDLTFNLGMALAAFEQMFAAIAKADWKAAGDALQHSLWYRQVGERGPRLVFMLVTGQDPNS